MKFSESGISYAKQKYGAFGDLRGFPQNQQALDARAKALLRIAHPVVVCKKFTATWAQINWDNARMEIFDDEARRQWRKDNPKPNSYTPSDEDWAADWDAMDAATLTHSELGTINPMDWLIDLAVDTCDFCPTPIQLRRMFRKFDCAVDVEVPEVE